MKSDAVKTAAGFEAIKAKALQFPPDLIDVKPSVTTARISGINSDAFETSSPPFYALRFLSSTTPASEQLKSRLLKSRAKIETEPESSTERNDKQLPTVELTISKKIKFPHDKKLAFGKRRHEESQLTASDRVIIEELRHHLRGQPRAGTTSVLEAIGDPEVREQRLYYEPLKSFLQGKEDPENKTFNDVGLRVVDIMIPSFEKRMPSDSGVVLPLTLSRHHAAVSRNANRLRSNTTLTFLPKVEGNSLIGSMDRKQTQTSQMRFYNPDIPAQDTPAIYSVQKRKTQLNLPRIGMKRDEDYDNNRVKFNKRKVVATVNENQQRSKASTVQFPVRQEVNNFGGTNGFPRRATTTATGKSHLIGPMNKMDIIADYSKALQSGMITYNEYMKKVSVLSLHKVNLANSAQRHFHLIRDESNNMRPKLTHVDVNPSTTRLLNATSEQGEVERKKKFLNTNDKTTKVSQALSSNNESASEVTDSLNADTKSDRSRLHRIDIGEGLSLFEKHKSGPDFSDDFVLTDLTRYTHVHHPRQNRHPHYHWNHEGGTLLGAGMDPGNQRHLLHWQTSNQLPSHNMNNYAKVQESSREEKDFSKTKPKVLLSMEEYLQLHAPHQTSNGYPLKPSLSAIGENENKPSPLTSGLEKVKTMQESLEYVGKIPIPVDDTEPMGLGAKDLVKTVNFKLPGNPLKEVTDALDEIPDVDSVFQSHLDNMLKTIKKSKASKKCKVPELKGLVPTIVPQVRVENKNNDIEVEKETAKNIVLPKENINGNFLAIQKKIPENTPPPTAEQKVNQLEESAQLSLTLSTPRFEKSTNQHLSTSFEAPPVAINNTDHRLQVNQPLRKPPTPKSVQSNRSFKVTVPGAVLEEASGSLSNSEIRIMTASVDLGTPSNDEENPERNFTDRSRLEVVITSMPVAPPASIATTSEGSLSGNEVD